MKKVLLFLMCAIIILCLAACGGTDTPDENDGETGDIHNPFAVVYAAYTAYAKDKGENPLDYEAWLDSIRGESGADGINGLTPYIGENGNWWIGDVDTKVRADAKSIVKIEKVSENGKTDNYRITYSDGSTDVFKITNGADGKDGVGILEVKRNTENELIILLTDGSQLNLGDITGPRGENGKDGKDGKDGIGIAEVMMNATPDGRTLLTIYYTDESMAPTVFYLPSADNGKDGNGIKDMFYAIEYDGSVKVTVTFTDDSVEPFEFIIPAAEAGLSVYNVISGTDPITNMTYFYFVYSDGTMSDYIYVPAGRPGEKGEDGKDGNGIKDMTYVTEPDGSVKVTVYFTDEDKVPFEFVIPAGKPGEDGKDGVGIYEITSSMEDGMILFTIYYTDKSIPPMILSVPISSGKDGNGIKDMFYAIEYDGSVKVTVTFTDDSVEPFEFIIPAAEAGLSVYNVISGTDPITNMTYFYFVYSDGSISDYIYIPAGRPGEKGEDGKDGVGIEKVEFDGNGDLLITFTDGRTETVPMPKKEDHIHTFGEWIVYGGDSGVYCESRLFYHICTECKAIEWKAGSYEDHKFNTVTVAPTCVSQGHDEHTCTICGKVEITNITETTDHTWKDEYATSKLLHWHDCAYCDAVSGYGEHEADETGYCAICSIPCVATEGLVYELSADRTYAKVVDYTGSATRVVIADEYKGVPVTEIYKLAFQDSKIVSVAIPNSVTSIGSMAFLNCSSLTAITIPGSVTTIGNSAFSGCVSATSLSLGEGVINIGDSAFGSCERLTSVTIPDSVENIGLTAFEGCIRLVSITIPDGETQIGRSVCFDCNSAIFTEYEYGIYIGDRDNPYAVLVDLTNKDLPSYVIHANTKIIAYGVFSNCANLVRVTIPNGVTTISGSAFDSCTSLTSATIPDSVTTVGDYAFNNCTALAFNQYDNACYLGNNANPYLVLVKAVSTSITSVKINENTRIIHGKAFYSCMSLTSVAIPDSITSMGSNSFSSCTKLTRVIIGANITDIPSQAFYYCNRLNEVYYTGTEADWNNLSIDYDNTNLTDATRYYYSENEPTTEGNFWHYIADEPTVWQ